jgi:nicotinate dehydrogenase subunit B
MTELLHSNIVNREFSRSTFVKGGGALVVAISVVGPLVAAKQAKGAVDPYASRAPYDQGLIESWLAVHADNTVTLKAGKVELGQGTLTGLMMIAAEELDVSLAQMKTIMNVDTDTSANQGSTVGSQGIQTGGQQVRAAAAAARNALLDMAAANLGVSKSSLTVDKGVVSGGGKTVTYGALVGDKLFTTRIPGVPTGAPEMPAAGRRAAGGTGTKPIAQYKIVGTSGIPRIDIPDKVNGKFTYVQNIKVPGMLHGRVVRPRGQGAYGEGTAPTILSVDASSIKGTGAEIVRYKNFLGVVAKSEYAAIQAAAQLKVTWSDPPKLPSSGNMFKAMREQDAAKLTQHNVATNTSNFDNAFAAAPVKLSQSYKFHYQGAMAMGPECCVAVVTPQGARVFSNTQSVWGLRQSVNDALAEVWGAKAPPMNRIRVTYYEGGSTYGGASPYDDVGQAAAVMSALTGKPVRVQFMRWDTHGWGNYGPPMLADLRGAVDANGKLTGFEFTGFVHQYYVTTPTQQAVSGKPAALPSGVGALATPMAGEAYTIGSHRVVRKTMPLENNYFKMRHLRAPVSPQTGFAAEQMIDELANAAKLDPIEFRRRNIAGTTADPQQRWKNVLESVATLSGWQPKVAASSLSTANVVTGRGMAFGHYSNSPSAGVADITVNKKTGKITVNHLYITLDAGYIVYPEGLKNNEEGAAIQGVSRALHEAVSFNTQRVTSTDWVSYPILRFRDAPKLTLKAVSRTDVPDPLGSGSRTTGAGEPAVVPGAAAIANAFFDATGVRIREAPMTPARVRAVLKAAGK